MPKCHDNRKRKKKIANRERRIKKWCENYFRTIIFPNSRVNLVGGYQFFPHPYKGGAKDDRDVRSSYMETSLVSISTTQYPGLFESVHTGQN